MSRGHALIGQAYHGVVAHLGGVLLASLDVEVGVGLAFGRGAFGQASEGGVDASADLLCVDVAHQNQYHVFGGVPVVVELDELAQARVLQVFGQADDGARIGMSLECLARYKLALYASGVVLIHIIFLVHTFQLGLEQAEYGVDEALRIDFEPFVDLVRGERVVVVGDVVAGTCVQAFSAHALDEVHKLVGNADLAFFHGQVVDLFPDGFFLQRVGLFGHFIVLGDDLFVDGLFLFPVQGADLVGTFEHDVLQIVGQTGVLGRVVDRTGAAGYDTIHVGLGVVFPYIYGKTVLQFEGFQPLSEGGQGKQCESQQKNRLQFQ